MKILMVFQFNPYPPIHGPAKRDFPFFLENCKGHDVSILSPGTPADEKQMRELFGKTCRRIVFVDTKRPRVQTLLVRIWLFLTGKSAFLRLYNSKFQEALDTLVAEEQFDLIHCTSVFLSCYRLPRGIPLIGDAHNVEYEILYRAYEQTKPGFRKLYYLMEYKRSREFEFSCFNRFDAVLTTTDKDLRLFREQLPHKTLYAIPNGVEQMFFEAPAHAPEQRTMVFTGLMSYYPNTHGILHFLDQVLPLVLREAPDARLWIVGADPPRRLRRRASENVIVTGYVADVRAFVKRAEVFIVPLHIGSGIRGKVLEAMAMNMPIVSTTVGCEGIALHHDESALFGDTPEEFASAVLRLFHDSGLRTRLATKAHATVVEGYSWETSGAALHRVYASLLQDSTTRTSVTAPATAGRNQHSHDDRRTHQWLPR